MTGDHLISEPLTISTYARWDGKPYGNLSPVRFFGAGPVAETFGGRGVASARRKRVACARRNRIACARLIRTVQ